MKYGHKSRFCFFWGWEEWWVLGPYLAVLRPYSRLSTQGSLLAVLGNVCSARGLTGVSHMQSKPLKAPVLSQCCRNGTVVSNQGPVTPQRPTVSALYASLGACTSRCFCPSGSCLSRGCSETLQCDQCN